MCYTALLLIYPPPPPPLSGRGPTPEGVLKAASRLLHSQRETKPVSHTPLLVLLHHFSFSSCFFFILSSSLLLGERGAKMMQEVSIMVAYDAHVVDRPGEEDTLACLVAHSRPLRTLRPVVGWFSRHYVYLFYCLSSVFICLCLLLLFPLSYFLPLLIY